MSGISEILRLADFPDGAVECFDGLYSRIESDGELTALLLDTERVYLSGEDSKELRERLAERLGTHIYTAEMLLLLHCSIGLRKTYRERGYAEELYLGVLTDLRCKLLECKRVYGRWGTFVFSWFYRFYNCTRFAIGRLQFETVAAKYDYKDTFRVGDTVYNCHIPSAGPLTPELVEASLAAAHEFYKIDGVMPVVCHSWLLYPKHYELFGANTRAFYDRFDVVLSGERRDNDDAWRVFGRDASDIESLPQETSLQRAFYKYFKDGGKMGDGFGVMLYSPAKKGEKCE